MDEINGGKNQFNYQDLLIDGVFIVLNIEDTPEKQKINALSSVLRLGHEAFQKKDLSAINTHILNNSKLVLNYDRACIIDMHSKTPRVISIMGQTQCNNNSEYCYDVRALLKTFPKIDKITFVTNKIMKEHKADPAALKAFKHLSKFSKNIILVPMPPPETEASTNELYIWMLEYATPINDQEPHLISLLSHHYREAIWYKIKRKETKIKAIIRKRKIFTTKNILAIIFILFVISLFFKTHQSVAASFELIPTQESVRYAPYTGIINEALYKNGANVTKGDTIIRYNTKELSYQLSGAVNSLEEIKAEMDLAKQRSFSDDDELNRVKLLQLKQNKFMIEIDRLRWYLTRSKLVAKDTGTLVIDDNKKWTGKSVTAGEKLFEIVNSKNIIAKVMLNESEAAVLGKNTKIALFLYSQPEKPIFGEQISVSPKPLLTETGQFCYIIKMKLNTLKPNYIFGMRGIARVQGDKVSIGYYLFKSLVLWWRKI